MPEVRKQMHQTTVRFDGEIWRRIDIESRRIGVSSAQYIRDAALIRLTHESHSDRGALAAAGSGGVRANAAAAISAADVIGTESSAVWAQARQARERATALRQTSRHLADLRSSRPWAGGGWDVPPEADGSK